MTYKFILGQALLFYISPARVSNEFPQAGWYETDGVEPIHWIGARGELHIPHGEENMNAHQRRINLRSNRRANLSRFDRELAKLGGMHKEVYTPNGTVATIVGGTSVDNQVLIEVKYKNNQRRKFLASDLKPSVKAAN